MINEKYFRDVDDEQLRDASVRGMVDSLRKEFKDRFSHYFSPDEYAEFQTQTEGRFSGRRPDRQRGQARACGWPR